MNQASRAEEIVVSLLCVADSGNVTTEDTAEFETSIRQYLRRMRREPFTSGRCRSQGVSCASLAVIREMSATRGCPHLRTIGFYVGFWLDPAPSSRSISFR